LNIDRRVQLACLSLHKLRQHHRGIYDAVVARHIPEVHIHKNLAILFTNNQASLKGTSAFGEIERSLQPPMVSIADAVVAKNRSSKEKTALCGHRISDSYSSFQDSK